MDLDKGLSEGTIVLITADLRCGSSIESLRGERGIVLGRYLHQDLDQLTPAWKESGHHGLVRIAKGQTHLPNGKIVKPFSMDVSDNDETWSWLIGAGFSLREPLDGAWRPKAYIWSIECSYRVYSGQIALLEDREQPLQAAGLKNSVLESVFRRYSATRN